MNRKAHLLMMVAALSASPALAYDYDHDYQWETQLGFQPLAFPEDTPEDRNRGHFQAIYYPQPVRTCCHPLKELAFVNRATAIHASYEYEDDTFQEIYRLGADYYYIPGMYGAAQVTHVRKFAQPELDEGNDTGFGIVLGLVPQSLPQLRLTAGVTWNSPDHFQRPVVAVTTKFFHQTEGGGALNLELVQELVDNPLKSTITDLSAELYYNRHISIGTGINISSNRQEENVSPRVSTELFLTRLISLSVEYRWEKSLDNNPSRVADSLSGQARVRF
ncbi:MAG: putative porin [Oleiphilaceae bacterium]|nr:putative porin [Oleiphilaceae bacterium]